MYFLLMLFWFLQGQLFGLNHSAWKFLQADVNFSCSGSSATCSITVSSTTSGSTMGISYILESTATTYKISSASGGGGTWTLCGSSACYIENGTTDQVDAAYNLSGTGGATSISVTITGTPDVGWAAEFVEAIKAAPAGSAVLDHTVTGDSTGCSSCTNPSNTLTGTDDARIVFCDDANSESGLAPVVWGKNNGPIFYAMDIQSGAGATWTQSPSGFYTCSEEAFK